MPTTLSHAAWAIKMRTAALPPPPLYPPSPHPPPPPPTGGPPLGPPLFPLFFSRWFLLSLAPPTPPPPAPFLFPFAFLRRGPPLVSLPPPLATPSSPSFFFFPPGFRFRFTEGGGGRGGGGVGAGEGGGGRLPPCRYGVPATGWPFCFSSSPFASDNCHSTHASEYWAAAGFRAAARPSRGPSTMTISPARSDRGGSRHCCRQAP